MHGGRGDLPRLIADLEAGRLTGAVSRDYVLLLQEFVDHGDAARSASRALTVFVRPVRGASSNAIVSTIPLEDTRAIDLPRERQLRAAVAATISILPPEGGSHEKSTLEREQPNPERRKSNSERLFVVSTHLENRLGWLRGLFGDRARGRQVETLLRELPIGHGIVGGDMNTMLGPDEPAWRALLGRFPDTPERPEPTFRNRLVLDHLFFDIPDAWRVTRRVVADRYGSDHHPVVAEIR